MRWLINDKGMMFGNRINIIDFLVVIFILSLTPMLWVGYKIFNKPRLPLPPQINWEWQNKYNEEITNKEKVFKEHKRMKKYFK